MRYILLRLAAQPRSLEEMHQTEGADEAFWLTATQLDNYSLSEDQWNALRQGQAVVLGKIPDGHTVAWLLNGSIGVTKWPSG